MDLMGKTVHRFFLVAICAAVFVLVFLGNQNGVDVVQESSDPRAAAAAASVNRRHLQQEDEYPAAAAGGATEAGLGGVVDAGGGGGATGVDDGGNAPVADQTIEAVERLCVEFDFGGYTFDERGRSAAVARTAVSCLIHSFSPYVEREVARRFLDPARDQVYFANSPAILFHRRQLLLVSRIWLDRERYEPKDDWPANHFADNWLYTQRFDRQMRPASNGSILGIPAPKQWWVGDGPIEPRLFRVGDRVFVTFNAAMAFAPQRYMDFTVIWDLAESRPIIPRIAGGTPMINATEGDDMPRDKHWMALVDRDDQLYFVHNLDPLRVLGCTLAGHCRFVHREQNAQGFIFADNFNHLRGGTPFEVYRWPYYVSVAHTTMYKDPSNRRYYTAHLVVICVRPWRVVYVSGDVKIHRKLYAGTPMVRDRYIDDGFIFPVGLIVESADSIAVGVHVNDHSSVVLRVRGVAALMERIMALDAQSAPARGPPVGYLQQHVHDTLENITHIRLIHDIRRAGQ